MSLATVEKEFVSVLDTIGKDFEIGLTEVVKYLPEADILAGFIFPPAVAPLQAATSAADLLQNAIALAEQKYAAQGAAASGAQKAADVLTAAQGAVTSLLANPQVQSGLQAAGITVNADYVSNLISAIVGILNVRGTPVATAPVSLVPAGTPVN